MLVPHSYNYVELHLTIFKQSNTFCLLQGMSSRVSELEEELAKANSDLEQEKATTLAQIEEIEALKKVDFLLTFVKGLTK